MSKVIYLASPYSHESETIREMRFALVCEAAASLMSKGTLVFSPIAHTHPIAKFGLPTGFDFYEEYDREMIKRCDSLVVLTLDGYEHSKGVEAEVKYAHELGKEVTYLPPEPVTTERTLDIYEAHLEKEEKKTS